MFSALIFQNASVTGGFDGIIVKSPRLFGLDLDPLDHPQRYAGLLPVGENDQLVGMISDRDIAVRAVAQGKGPDTPIREVMTPDVKYCFEDEDTEHVARKMGDQQIRRLPVMSRDKRLVGILSLGDLTSIEPSATVAQGLAGISRPVGAHSQKTDSQGPNE